MSDVYQDFSHGYTLTRSNTRERQTSKGCLLLGLFQSQRPHLWMAEPNLLQGKAETTRTHRYCNAMRLKGHASDHRSIMVLAI